MKLRRPARDANAGFTLVEVMLAMGLLLLGATAILGLLTFGAALARTAELRTVTAEAVDAVVADLEEGLFALEENGSTGDPVPITDRPVPGRPELVYSATATPEPLEGDGPVVSERYRVDVEIRHENASGPPRKFSVLLLREVPFGERMRRSFTRPGQPAAKKPAETAPENEQPEDATELEGAPLG